ncbi:hypothetical protein X943_000764 [Babesia divergens]|uniref:Uncharacterized protein n=1 Tax=Babesia divergens TaxID=32595 RepID=A0AAD9G6I5_BABDI|nr:hypothetical protein X943_000764 [Babesia divergens]
MRLSIRHAPNARNKLHGKQKPKKSEVDDTQYRTYNIDDYIKIVSDTPPKDAVSHLEVNPAALLNTIANSANFVLDQVSDFTSGAFPTTNNAGRMNPYISSLHQQINAIKNPVQTPLPNANMLQAQNPQLTVHQPAVQPVQGAVMAPVVQPAVVAPTVATVQPQVVAPGVMAVQPQVAAASVPMVRMEERSNQVAQNINDTLASTYVTPHIPERLLPRSNYMFVMSIVAIVMLIMLFVVGCIYRIRQRRKKNHKS